MTNEFQMPPTTNPYRGRTAFWIVVIGIAIYIATYCGTGGGAPFFNHEWSGKSFGVAGGADIEECYVGPRLKYPIPWTENQGNIFLGFGLLYRFSWADPDMAHLHEWFMIGLPWWYIIALIAAPALDRFGLRKAQEKYRRKHGRSTTCAKCGYDLRATPDRCPECGTITNQ